MVYIYSLVAGIWAPAHFCYCDGFLAIRTSYPGLSIVQLALVGETCPLQEGDPFNWALGLILQGYFVVCTHIDQEKNSGRIYHVLIVYGSSVAGVCWFGTGPCQEPHILCSNY